MHNKKLHGDGGWVEIFLSIRRDLKKKKPLMLDLKWQRIAAVC